MLEQSKPQSISSTALVFFVVSSQRSSSLSFIQNKVGRFNPYQIEIIEGSSIFLFCFALYSRFKLKTLTSAALQNYLHITLIFSIQTKPFFIFMNKLIYTLQALRRRLDKISPLYSVALVLLLGTANQAFASAPGHWAQVTVTGKVTDAKGEALIGTTVLVKDQAGVGTITDFDGTYTINVDENAVLVFSFTGYEKQEIAVGGRKVIDVILQDASTLLNQVVVVGYGTLTKKQVTGAIAQVKGDDLKKQPLLTPIQGVQGLASGIQVIGSGEPGSQPRVQIRGVNTVLTNENPLYVVDGVITNDITNINANDVFSIDVLKDGAAAIYGTRAGNGVILITTKRGKEGKMAVSLDSYVGYRQLINVVDMADAKFYAEYTNEARAYEGTDPLFSLDTLRYNTDWFDEISQKGLVQSYNLNISGGSDKLTYLFSAGYFGDEGVLKGAEFERITLRANNEYRPFKFLKFGHVLNANIVNSRNKPTGAFTDAYRIGATAPVISPYPTNGLNPNYGYISGLSVANPVATLDLAHNYDKANRFQGNFYGEAAIIDGLSFRSSLGYDKSTGGNTNYNGVYKYGIYNNSISELRFSNYEQFFWVWDNTLKLSKQIGKISTSNSLRAIQRSGTKAHRTASGCKMYLPTATSGTWAKATLPLSRCPITAAFCCVGNLGLAVQTLASWTSTTSAERHAVTVPVPSLLRSNGARSTPWVQHGFCRKKVS